MSLRNELFQIKSVWKSTILFNNFKTYKYHIGSVHNLIIMYYIYFVLITKISNSGIREIQKSIIQYKKNGVYKIYVLKIIRNFPIMN